MGAVEMKLLTAREWLCQGGGGHEDGEDGIRAVTLNGEELVEMLDAYREYIIDKVSMWLMTK